MCARSLSVIPITPLHNRQTIGHKLLNTTNNGSVDTVMCSQYELVIKLTVIWCSTCCIWTLISLSLFILLFVYFHCVLRVVNHSLNKHCILLCELLCTDLMAWIVLVLLLSSSLARSSKSSSSRRRSSAFSASPSVSAISCNNYLPCSQSNCTTTVQNSVLARTGMATIYYY